ncbi:hypothetical protein BaRGS_00026676, partial [Batillaria attramentaria]
NSAIARTTPISGAPLSILFQKLMNSPSTLPEASDSNFHRHLASDCACADWPGPITLRDERQVEDSDFPLAAMSMERVALKEVCWSRLTALVTSLARPEATKRNDGLKIDVSTIGGDGLTIGAVDNLSGSELIEFPFVCPGTESVVCIKCLTTSCSLMPVLFTTL